MSRTLVRRIIPQPARAAISAVEDFARFDLYANHIVKQRVDRLLAKRSEPIRFVFILTTPRSGSTLLGRLLNANPGVAGFGEHHADYLNARDLDRLVYRTAAVQQDFDPSRVDWVMDKLVGTNTIGPAVLDRPDVCAIVLDRDPFAVFDSSVRVFGWDLDVDMAHSWAAEYDSRVSNIVAMADHLSGSGRLHYVRYGDLLSHTDRVLAELTNFLRLDVPLIDRYETSGSTRLKYGDVSSNVRQGQIVRGRTHDTTAAPEIFDADLVERIRISHRRLQITAA